MVQAVHVDNDFILMHFSCDACDTIGLCTRIYSTQVKPCVLNSSLPDRLKLPASKKFVDIIDPVIRDGRVQAQPPAGSFSYIKTSDEPRVPEQGSP